MKRRALAVIGLWIAVLAIALPLAGKLGDVTTERPSEFLPASAQSAKVADIEATLPGGSEHEITIVYSRDSGVTAADRSAAAHDRGTLQRAFGIPLDDGGVLTSPDGTTMRYSLSIGESHGEAPAVVDAARAEVAEARPDGLVTAVSGPSAMEADMEAAFDGIDEQLLIVTVLVVTVLLLLTYRSPVLWLLPLVSVGLATVLSMATAYGLVELFGIAVNDQNSAILTVLSFGVGTDYALLIVARYREELRRHTTPGAAMMAALRRAAPALIASAATVTAGLLCLLLADMNNTASMGPVGAATIICTLIAMLTFFPALLVLLGRRVFWPRIPRYAEGEPVAERRSIWDRVGAWIDRRRTLAVVGSLGVLAVLTLGLFGQTNHVSQADAFVNQPESVTGQVRLTERFAQAGGMPMTVMATSDRGKEVLTAVRADPGVAQAEVERTAAGWSEIQAFPKAAPDTKEEAATINRLRSALPAVDSGALVGGPSAENLDVADASGRDQWIVIPLVLLVVTVILGLLLRSVVAAVGLVATVVVSYAAALGAGVFASEHVFGFHGLDPGLVVLSFLFLVALGVDYNIFLMTRAREEAARAGTQRGILRALSTTGGVITSAGLVLAATFAALTTLPLVAMTQLGFVVAFGVLLDTLLVRSVLVPALALLGGDRIWWPTRPGPSGAVQPEAEPTENVHVLDPV